MDLNEHYFLAKQRLEVLNHEAADLSQVLVLIEATILRQGLSKNEALKNW